MDMNFKFMPMIGEVPQSSVKVFHIRESGLVYIRDAYLLLNVWDVGGHRWRILINDSGFGGFIKGIPLVNPQSIFVELPHLSALCAVV